MKILTGILSFLLFVLTFRSPWSNKYIPAYDGTQPPPDLRELEIQFNNAFDIYRELYDSTSMFSCLLVTGRYYEGGVSSVYLWETDEGSENFAGCVLIKKSMPHSLLYQFIYLLY
jgi:capping protein beta